MEYNKLIKRAEGMPYKLPFFNDEYREDFFKNLDKNIILEEDDYIFFIDRASMEKILFWAGKDMEAVISGLEEVHGVLEKGEKLSIRCVGDAKTPGSIEYQIPYFVNKGAYVTYHNMGYKASNLNIQKECSLVSISEGQDEKEAFDIACVVLGEEKFAMDLEEFQSYTEDEDKFLFVIKDQQRVVGCILGYIYNNGKMVFIRGLAVDEQYRGLGYATQLLSKTFQWAREKGAETSMLWVEKNNSVAIALYEKFGYTFYGDQEVALEYVL